eukprot:SAG31_NODE_34620_length_331_cov_0.767241_2_plen_79_part_01
MADGGYQWQLRAEPSWSNTRSLAKAAAGESTWQVSPASASTADRVSLRPTRVDTFSISALHLVFAQLSEEYGTLIERST